MEHAIEQAIARADQTLDDLRWFEVAETRGKIEDGKVAKTGRWFLKVGFNPQGRLIARTAQKNKQKHPDHGTVDGVPST
jgi:flavin-binding protein dodecin